MDRILCFLFGKPWDTVNKLKQDNKYLRQEIKELKKMVAVLDRIIKDKNNGV